MEVSDGTTTLQQRLESMLRMEIERGSFPGAAFLVGGWLGNVAGSLGQAVIDPRSIPATLDTIWDVASLTKPLMTATLALQLAAEGVLNLEDRVSSVLTEFRGTEKEAITFLDLLTHRSGFEAWYPLYADGVGDDAYLRALTSRPMEYACGSRVVYSCLGYITLHLAMERLTGESVEAMARRRIFEPLGLEGTYLMPPASLLESIAATDRDNGQERRMVAERGLVFDGFRDGIIHGEVNDGNAFHMGGFAGNAGLFSTAGDVFTLGRAWLTRDPRLLPAEFYERALTNYTPGLEENRGIGWLLSSASGSALPGSVLSPSAFGHTGFTGVSLWIDPERDLVAVLLTNRIHPVARESTMQTIRRNFHAAIVESFPGS